MNVAVLASPWAVLLALAAYRLTRLWIDDTLPPLPRLRNWLESKSARWSLMFSTFAYDRRHPNMPTPDPERDRHVEQDTRRIDLYGGEPAIGSLWTCYWCAGFWIALAVVLIAALVPVAVWAVPFAALALSATTGLLANLAE